jgi:hypothetical protein
MTPEETAYLKNILTELRYYRAALKWIAGQDIVSTKDPIPLISKARDAIILKGIEKGPEA